MIIVPTKYNAEVTYTPTPIAYNFVPTVMLDNPVLFYRFSTGSFLNDDSGFNNDITINGDIGSGWDAATQVSSLSGLGQAASFNGNAYTQTPDAASISSLGVYDFNSHGSFAVEFLINITAYPAASKIIILKGGTTARGWFIQLRPNGILVLQVHNTSSSACRITSTIPLTIGVWNHVIISLGLVTTYESSIIINGNIDPISIEGSGGIGNYGDGGFPLTLGASVLTATPTVPFNFFQGIMDEILIFPDGVSTSHLLNHSKAIGFDNYVEPVTAYYNDVYADNPIAFFRFEEYYGRRDSSQYYIDAYNDLLITGIAYPTLAVGQVGNCGDFSSGSHYLRLIAASYNNDLLYGSSIITFEFMLKDTNLTHQNNTTRTVMSKGRDGVDGWGINLSYAGNPYIIVPYSSTDMQFSFPPASIITGYWYHIVIVAQGNSTSTTGIRKVYLNGVQLETRHSLDPIGTQSTDSAYHLYMGGQRNSTNSGFNRTLQGSYLDEVAIYNYELTADRILSHFNNTGITAFPDTSGYSSAVLADSPVLYHKQESGFEGTDSSGLGNNGTLTDITLAHPWVSGAVYYNGTTSHIDVPNSASIQGLADGSGIVTVELLIYIARYNQGQAFISKGRASRDGWAFFIDGSNYIYAQSNYSTTNGLFKSAVSGYLLHNTWKHLVISMQGNATSTTGVRKMWVNGTPIAITHVSNPAGTKTSDASYPLKLGSNLSTGGSQQLFWLGSSDEVAVYNYELSDAQVAAHFAATGL